MLNWSKTHPHLQQMRDEELQFLNEFVASINGNILEMMTKATHLKGKNYLRQCHCQRLDKDLKNNIG